MLSKKEGMHGHWDELGIVVAGDGKEAVKKVNLRVRNSEQDEYRRTEEDGFCYINIRLFDGNGGEYSLESIREITGPLPV